MFNILKSITIKSLQCCTNIQKYLQQIFDLFILTNELSLELEAISNCDNFTVITILQ